MRAGVIRKCANCAYWNKTLDPNEHNPGGAGICKRHPPVLLLRQRYKEPEEWQPFTPGVDWCGEFCSKSQPTGDSEEVPNESSIASV